MVADDLNAVMVSWRVRCDRERIGFVRCEEIAVGRAGDGHVCPVCRVVQLGAAGARERGNQCADVGMCCPVVLWLAMSAMLAARTTGRPVPSVAPARGVRVGHVDGRSEYSKTFRGLALVRFGQR